jgi:hypothetical protein
MKHRQFAILGGAVAALALGLSAPALGAGSGVTVRVEGLKRTLLPATVAHAESGSVTRAGAPSGSCPGSAAIGYFDSATHHKWGGSYSSGLGVEVTSVLGETHKFSAKGFYWGLWLNNKFASAGLCDLKLKPGDQLLLAPAPGSGSVSPIMLSAPRSATVGTPFTVKASYFKTLKHGTKLTVLQGAKVTDGAAVTAKDGTASVTATKAGKLTVVATEKGFVRAEATVTVSK